ncbi:unnamed protein product [Aureobasidium pullulans]|nr:unnamed protein product [Aureobasidium pullulans]
MPDQTIKEHFDTIATALDAATTRAAGYSKTIQTCMNQDKRLKSAYKRYRTEKAQLGAESQTLRAQNDRLTEIIVKNANIPKKMQEEIDDLNFRLAGLPFYVLYQGITRELEGTTTHTVRRECNIDRQEAQADESSFVLNLSFVVRME